MRSLAGQLESGEAEVVAVVGLAKNCGKTTTLNHLIAAYRQLGRRLGITSIGRDGEPLDLITRRPKPRIRVEAGTLAITAEASLAGSQLAARVVARTGITSALGELLLVEAEGSGRIELSGPTTMEEARRTILRLRQAGAERVLVDGALDRRSSAAPSVSQAVVLSGGAVLGRTVESVAARMAHQVALFRLPTISGDDAPAVVEAACRCGPRAAIIAEDGRVTELSGSALTKCEELTAALGHSSGHLWAGGGVTDSLVDELLKCRAAPEIVVEDATRIFLSPMSCARWQMAGGRLRVLRAIRLAALTTNPVRPSGRGMEAGKLVDAVAQEVPGLPVYDVVAGLVRGVAEEAVANSLSGSS